MYGKYITGAPVHCLRREDPAYPPVLRQYERMPVQLYVRGNLPDPQKKCVAIVGARSCTNYGKQEALRFARALAGHGVQILSGMALGIDSWAHIGALEAGGATFAVLGCGVDICYPASHAALYRQILTGGGGILSELSPGAPPLPYHFPLRNRIISALADIVLVIEARKRSGSLITVSYALEQGKSIYAVPGKNGDPLSEGCNRMISDGAGIAQTPDQLLQELGITAAGECPKAQTPMLPEALAKDPVIGRVYACLSSEGIDPGALAERTGLTLSEITRALVRLQLEEYVVQEAGSGFMRMPQG